MNLSAISSKIKTVFNTYKWLLIPGIPLALFLGLTIYLFIPQDTSQKVPLNESVDSPNPTNIRTQITPRLSLRPSITPFKIPSASTNQYEFETEIHTPIQSLPGFQKKESLPNGLDKYTVTSSNPSRPDIYIMQNDSILLERKLLPPELGTKIVHYTESYGSPQRKITGSSFHGSTAEEYIYASIGLSFVADPQTGNVLEKRLFPPMSVDDYLRYIKVYE